MFSRSILVVHKSCCHAFPKQSSISSIPLAAQSRWFSLTSCKREEDEKKAKQRPSSTEGARGYKVVEIDYITSQKYLESDAYKTTYGDEPVWKNYRRKFGYHFQPPTRKTCIRSGVISTGSACPICRDDYLVIDYRNMKLMEQLISKVTHEALNPKMTGLCGSQYRKLKVEILKAKDYGLLKSHIPLRAYNYDYYRQLVASEKPQQQELEQKSAKKKTEKVKENTEKAVSSEAVLSGSDKRKNRKKKVASSGKNTEMSTPAVKDVATKPASSPSSEKAGTKSVPKTDT